MEHKIIKLEFSVYKSYQLRYDYKLCLTSRQLNIFKLYYFNYNESDFTMNLSPNWTHYFEQLETNDELDRHLSVLSATSTVNAETDENDIIRLATEDPDIVIMTVSQITGDIKLLHSFRNLGGTRLRPSHKIVALDGFDTSSTPVIIGLKSITDTVEIRTPSYNSLRTLTTASAIEATTIPTNGNKNFTHTTFVILPPFLSLHVIKQESRDPHSLFLTCLETIEDFDELNIDDTSMNKATEHCRHVLSYLWAATKELIPSINMVPGHDDQYIKRWSNARHQMCISSTTVTNYNQNPQAISDEVVQSLAQSINTQSQLFETFRQEKSDEKEKSNKFETLHDSTKMLILNASSTDGITAAILPTDSCKEFYMKKNISKALDLLSTTMSQEYECCVQLETGLVTALHAGHFLRDREDSPSNFSFFLTPKKQPLSSDRFKSTMILQLKATQGKGWSETDFKEALKQGIVTPSNVSSLIHQLKKIGN